MPPDGRGHVPRPRRRALAERSGDGPTRRVRTEKAKKSTQAFSGRVSVESNVEWVGSGVFSKNAANRAERKSEPDRDEIKPAWAVLQFFYEGFENRFSQKDQA
jgi:hypothetical protein